MTLHTRLDIKTLQICEKLLEGRLGGRAEWRVERRMLSIIG